MVRHLSKNQREILELLTEHYLTVKQIASRRGKSVQSIYKTMSKLREKGFLKGNLSRGLNNPGVPLGGGGFNMENKYLKEIRLHAEHFLVSFLRLPKNLRESFPIGSRFVLDENTVFVWRDKVEVYSNKSFFGVDVDAADKESLIYWSGFFGRLEDRLGVLLLQPREANVVRVRAEFAEVGNELAAVSRRDREKIRVVGKDGKCWLVADFSNKVDELETVDRDNAKADMGEVVQPFFNDLRKNPVLLSQIVRQNEITAGQLSDVATGLKVVVDLLQPKKVDDVSEVVVVSRPSYVG